MILIYGKGKVGNALKTFCDYNKIESEIKDDTDNINNFDKYSVIIPSPGVPPTNRIYKTGKIVGELDFVYDYLPKNSKIITITGTDGKSTTTRIVYNILKQEYGENRVFLAGNFDEPFSEVVTRIQKNKVRNPIIVMEVSSFMAYNIKKFKTDYSIFTNLEPDHLNWHPDMKCYFESKLNLIKNTTKKSIINSQVIEQAKKYGVKLNFKNIHLFSYNSDKNQKDRIEMPNIIISGRKKYNMNETKFSGLFNALNILSATLVTNEMKICSKRTKKYLSNIGGLSHRIEFYKEINGVKFIDDSKSTSSQSLKAALSAFDGNIILIAGGSDKGDNFEGLEDSLENKVKYGVLIGQTRDTIAKKFEKAGIRYNFAESMDEAVNKSWANSNKGDIVLLSPGCASFGLFKDYLDRANKFREAVNNLK